MGDMEVDWDDVGPRRPRSRSRSRDAAADGHGAADVREDAVAVVAVPSSQRPNSSTARASRWSAKIPCPQKRTADQQRLAASRMRDRKAARKLCDVKGKLRERLEECFAKLRECGLLRDRGKTRVRLSPSDVLSIRLLPSGKPSLLPFEAMQHIAYTPLNRKADVAKAFGLCPKTVNRVRILAAAALETADDKFMVNMIAEFERVRPLVFVSSIAADATQERLTLEMRGLEEMKHVGRSAWHVLVSLQRFSFVRGGDDGPGGWVKIDFTRPSVAMVSSESGETIWQGLYHVKSVKHFSQFEMAGLRRAKWAFLHFDLDGHSGGLRSTALRRQEIINAVGPDNKNSMPAVSVRHCGNHSQNLTDNQIWDAHPRASDIYTFMQTGTLFFKMGGSFLRLVQAVKLDVEANFQLPLIGEPPAEAVALSCELRDYCERNYRGFLARYIDDGWSSGDDDDDVAFAAGTRDREKK